MNMSGLVKNWQATLANKKVREQLLSHQLEHLKPDWVDDLSVLRASTHKVELIANVEGIDWGVWLTPSFHGIHVQVVKGNCKKTQARLSKDLALRLNH
jgi:hypothetical protein